GADIALVESLIRNIDEELKREPQLRATLEEAQQAQEAAQAALEAAEARLKEVEHATADLRSAQERKASIEQRLNQIERDLVAVANDIERQQKRMVGYEAIIEARAEIEEGFAALQAARAADHELAEKLMQLSDFDAQRRALEQQIDAARAELEREISGYKATIAQLERTISIANPEDYASVQAELLTLEDLEKQREAFQEEVAALENERSELKANNNNLYIQMKELEDRLNRLRAVDGAVCPLCGQPLDEASRNALIEQLQAEGKAKGDTYRANQAHMDAMIAEIAQRKESITDLNI